MTEHRLHTRAELADLTPALAAWDEGGAYARSLHVGDLSWFFRHPDEHLDGKVHGWWRDGRLVAVAIVEDTVARPRIAPDLLHDRALADEVAEVLEALPGEEVWSEAVNGSRLRQTLAVRGWEPEPDTWAALYADSSAGRATAAAQRASDDPDVRVAVQRAGFENSTFDRAAWDRMSALPAYDAGLDLVLRDREGNAVAAGTAWLAGEGVALVEPFSVHRDHRRRGHGTVLGRALVAACVERGASGVSVCTPADNPGAVATYRAAGFRVVETLQDLVRPRRSERAQEGP